jgi:ATP-binding cassette subfamily B protein
MAQDLALEEEFAQTRLTRTTWTRVLSYIKPYRWRILVPVVLEVLWVGSNILDTILIQQTMDSVIPRKSLILALLVAGGFVFNIIARYWIGIVELRMLLTAGQSILNNIRIDVFRKIESLHMGYFDKTKEGRIIARADRDVDTLEAPLVWGPIWVMSCIASIVITVITMAVYNGKLCLIVMTGLPFLLLAANLLRVRGMSAYRNIREALSRISSFLAESINGIRIIKSFGRERHFLGQFTELNTDYRRTVVKQARVWNIFYPLIGLIYAFTVILILWFGGTAVWKGSMTAGELTAFFFLLGMFFGPIQGLTEFYNTLLSAAAAAERIFLLLDTEPEIRDAKDARPLACAEGKAEFQKVGFRYGKKSDWILKDVSFLAPPGSCIALVGHTGSGKTSILNLLIRFYENEKGSVRIDDQDLKTATLASLRRHTAIVLQDNFLFSGTVMENLKYGKPGVTDAEVKACAKRLGSHDVIMRMSKGYLTEVRERGGGISTGERQLICLTRVFVADPKIVILDEATSSVDTQTEKAIQHAMKRILKGRTVFIAAHRLSTIRNADQILLIDKGCVIEKGDFRSLMARRGRFRKLYDTYSR